jgi:hypothetical protein
MMSRSAKAAGRHVQSLLCRPLDYADHWLRTGSGGGDRCVGVGIIRLISQRMVSFLPIEGGFHVD